MFSADPKVLPATEITVLWAGASVHIAVDEMAVCGAQLFLITQQLIILSPT